MKKIQVLIVDSSIQIINRLEEILSETESIRSIYKAVTSEEAGKLFKKIRPDAVVLDAALHGNNVFELISEIKKTNPSTVLIVLSIHMDERVQEQCKSLGADFFLDKYNEFGKIPAIISQIAIKKKRIEADKKLFLT